MLAGMAHAKSCAARSARTRRCRRPGNAGDDGDTIVLSTADRWGNMVSWVNSNYANFGSGITVPGYGFVLHNRGGLFTLDPNSPNVIAPHKRPYNTLAASFRAAGRAHRRPDHGAAADGRRHAVPGPCPGDGEHGRSGRQSAGRFRHGALPSQPDDAMSCRWNPRPSNWWARSFRPWDTRWCRPMAAAWAAIRRILFTPDPKEPKPCRPQKFAPSPSTAPIGREPTTAKTAFRRLVT